MFHPFQVFCPYVHGPFNTPTISSYAYKLATNMCVWAGTYKYEPSHTDIVGNLCFSHMCMSTRTHNRMFI